MSPLIEPTEADIGRQVIYRSRFDLRGGWTETGAVVRFNSRFVWVRYGKAVTPQATDREDLHWGEER